MKLIFSDKKYLTKALALAAEPPQSVHSVTDTFFFLIRGATPGQLANLCRLIRRDAPELSIEECFAQTQAPPDEVTAKRIYGLACECLEQGTPLGDELPDGRHNSSDWMGHCLLEGRACGILARALGLDPDRARKLGMLHDYGRRCTHTLEHTLRGFELLVDAGRDAEALGCLTHSFLGGSRCANNEPAVPGFYVDEFGFPQWREDAERDDITDFLSRYKYTDYDTVLNIADLMATSRGIISPVDRLADIAKRRVLDPVNRGYFLAELTNTLNAVRAWIAGEAEPTAVLRASADVTEAELNFAFEIAAERFFEAYKAKAVSG